ncbi:MAG: VOC family protein [Dehalococcoidia bacterium]
MTAGVHRIESLNAVTLGVSDMARAAAFYAAAGFELKYGGAEAEFTSYRLGPNHLNLMRLPRGEQQGWRGRVIVYVADVDATYAHVVAVGLTPEFEPRDADWGERYFHMRDPDGHELSFARLLDGAD